MLSVSFSSDSLVLEGVIRSSSVSFLRSRSSIDRSDRVMSALLVCSGCSGFEQTSCGSPLSSKPKLKPLLIHCQCKDECCLSIANLSACMFQILVQNAGIQKIFKYGKDQDTKAILADSDAEISTNSQSTSSSPSLLSCLLNHGTNGPLMHIFLVVYSHRCRSPHHSSPPAPALQAKCCGLHRF